MTNILLLILSYALILVVSWAYFFSFYLRSRKRESLAIKSFEEVKAKLREEVAANDSIMNLLTNIHEVVLENYGEGTQSGLGRMIVRSACEMMSCTMGSLQVIEKSSQQLKGISYHNLSPEQVLLVGSKVGDGITGRCAESGKIVVVNELSKDTRVQLSKQQVPAQSLLAAPLKVNQRTVGVLTIYAEEPHHVFEEKKIRLLNILCNQSAIALENLELYRNLQDFYMDMALTLSQKLNKEEILTESDTLRRYARRVSQELRLPESIAIYVEYALILRSIGRSELDDLLLQKPGKLTSREYDQMKKVPEFGEKILDGIKFLSPVKPMILYHLEHWNGSGYPLGLRGEEIPMGSRIIAVLNAFHAMTTDRPYRKALADREALRELKSQSGIQFDPKVVEAFFHIYEDEENASAGRKSKQTSRASEQTPFNSFWEWN